MATCWHIRDKTEPAVGLIGSFRLLKEKGRRPKDKRIKDLKMKKGPRTWKVKDQGRKEEKDKDAPYAPGIPSVSVLSTAEPEVPS